MTNNLTAAQKAKLAAALKAAWDADIAFHALDVNAVSVADYNAAYALMKSTRQIAIDLQDEYGC